MNDEEITKQLNAWVAGDKQALFSLWLDQESGLKNMVRKDSSMLGMDLEDYLSELLAVVARRGRKVAMNNIKVFLAHIKTQSYYLCKELKGAKNIEFGNRDISDIEFSNEQRVQYPSSNSPKGRFDKKKDEPKVLSLLEELKKKASIVKEWDEHQWRLIKEVPSRGESALQEVLVSILLQYLKKVEMWQSEHMLELLHNGLNAYPQLWTELKRDLPRGGESIDLVLRLLEFSLKKWRSELKRDLEMNLPEIGVIMQTFQGIFSAGKIKMVRFERYIVLDQYVLHVVLLNLPDGHKFRGFKLGHEYKSMLLNMFGDPETFFDLDRYIEKSYLTDPEQTEIMLRDMFYKETAGEIAAHLGIKTTRVRAQLKLAKQSLAKFFKINPDDYKKPK